MGTISKVLSGGSAVVVGSTGASFYAGKVAGSSKTPIQNELNKLKDNFTVLFFQQNSRSGNTPDEERKIMNDITKARKCSDYMWPGLVVGMSDSSVTSSKTGGCLHIDLKYSHERSILAHIEMTLSDGTNGIIFGGYISPSRKHQNQIEFLWWRMDVDKKDNNKWAITSGASVLHNRKFGYEGSDNKKFGVQNSIVFKSYFFGESTDTIVDLFRMCNRTKAFSGPVKSSRNCDFSKDSSDLWVHKTKTWKWDIVSSLNGQSTNRYVTEVFDILFTDRRDESTLIFGFWWWKMIDGKDNEFSTASTTKTLNLTYYLKNNGQWDDCANNRNASSCKSQSYSTMWGNLFTKSSVKDVAKAVYKSDKGEVDLSALKEL